MCYEVFRSLGCYKVLLSMHETENTNITVQVPICVSLLETNDNDVLTAKTRRTSIRNGHINYADVN